MILLMLFSTIPMNIEADELIDDSNVSYSSPAVRVQITSPVFIISADEVVTFWAKL